MHRSRLFAQHLPTYGWEPVILMVDEKHYEETLDQNLVSLLPPGLQIEKAGALPLTKPRLVGDIGLRSFFHLYKKAKHLIKHGDYDFLYIPIPSFYIALLGRWLNKSTGIPYGIDYIDPWVHHFPGSDKKFSRHWFSTMLAKWLEPIAIKNARLITGVAEGYYKGVQDRNPTLEQTCLFGAMPYGGEIADHEKVKLLNQLPYLFQTTKGKLQLVYAGAMLPKAYGPLERIFIAISNDPELFADLEIHFIGTGKSPNDPQGYNIKPLAEKYKIWEKVVFEYPKRIPYFDTLVHLNAANGIFILGSTEPHYTPSKVYQGILSEKPIFAVLHKQSSAVNVLKNSGAGVVLEFDGEEELDLIEKTFPNIFASYSGFQTSFNANKVDKEVFEEYSASKVTQKLASLLDEVTKNTK